MTTDEINTFLAIAKSKNISKAAEQLFLSQSTVSHRLFMLEKEIGRPLFERKKGHKDIVLTPWGEDLIPLASQWCDLHRKILDIQKRDEMLELSVGCVHSVNNYVFLPFFVQLHEVYPTLRFSFSTHHSWEIYNMLNEHKLDVGFVNNFIHYSNLDTVPVFKEQFYLIHNDPTLPKNGQSIRADQLDPSKEIFHTWSPKYQAWRESYMNTNMRPMVTINSPYMLESFLLHPGAWSIVPQSIAKKFQERTLFNVCTLDSPPPEKVCYMSVYKHQNARQEYALKLFQTQLNLFLSSL